MRSIMQSGQQKLSGTGTEAPGSIEADKISMWKITSAEINVCHEGVQIPGKGFVRLFMAVFVRRSAVRGTAGL